MAGCAWDNADVSDPARRLADPVTWCADPVTWCDRAFGLAGVGVLAGWLLLATVHATDLYRVDFSSGTWVAQAWDADRGRLFPAPADGGFYAGTRYGPVPIWLQQLVGSVTSDLTAAKLVNYGGWVALGVALWVALGRVGLRGGRRLALAALPSATEAGLLTSLGVHHDALLGALQLAAVLVIDGDHRRRGYVGAGASVLAGATCGVALAVKLSALWAPIAIVGYVLWRDRGRAASAIAAFVGAIVVVVGGLLGVAQIVSDGRLADNYAELLVGNETALGDLITSPQTALGFLRAGMVVAWVVAAIAAVALARRVRAGHSTVLDVALVAAVVTAVPLFADRTVGMNHLVMPFVLAIVAAGSLWAELDAPRLGAAPEPVARALVTTALAWALVAGWALDAGRDVREALAYPRDAEHWATADTARDLVPADGSILADNPVVPLLAGHRPVMGDAISFVRLARNHPEYEAELIGRIERHEFSVVVLQFRPEVDPDEFRDELGPAVAAAIVASYELDRTAAFGLHVYVPKGRLP
jgi:hypothetical protein